MTTPPDPPLPATVDLRNFGDMPLDVKRLRDSELAVMTKGDEFRCAVLLWCASWHQLPAASLPDDDALLAGLAGFGRVVKEWKRVKAGAMRGFVKCSDGRLYHQVVAQKALKAWRAKLEQAWKTECARLKKQAQRTKKEIETPEFDLWISRAHPESAPFLSQGTEHHVPEDTPPTSPRHPPGVPRETASKGREGKGRDTSSNERFPGDRSTTPPEATAKAEGSHPHVNPEAMARIVAECERAHVAEWNQDIAERWLRMGATPTHVITACAEARKSLHFPKPLPIGYVDKILVPIVEQDRRAREISEARIKRTAAQAAEQRTWTAAPMTEAVAKFLPKKAAA